MSTNGVQAGLADRDGPWMGEKLTELVHALRLRAARVVRMDPKGRMDPLDLLGDPKSRTTRLDPGADRDDACYALRTGTFDEHRSRLVARVEMRVRVRQGVAAASIRASSSPTTRSGSSFAKS